MTETIWVLITKTEYEYEYPVNAFTKEATAVTHLEGADAQLVAYYKAIGKMRGTKLTDDERDKVVAYRQFDPHFSPETRGYYVVATELHSD